MPRLANFYVAEEVEDDDAQRIFDVSPTLRSAQRTVDAEAATEVRWRDPEVTDGPGPLRWTGRDASGRRFEIALLTLIGANEVPVSPTAMDLDSLLPRPRESRS